MLMQYHDVPSSQLDKAKSEISGLKKFVKECETSANEQERKLNQLQNEGLIAYSEYHIKFN